MVLKAGCTLGSFKNTPNSSPNQVNQFSWECDTLKSFPECMIL